MKDFNRTLEKEYSFFSMVLFYNEGQSAGRILPNDRSKM